MSEVVNELKNDLKMKEDDFEELKVAFERMEKENARLMEKLQKETEMREVLETKLNKMAINKEIIEIYAS